MATTARKYNPGFLSDDELVKSFCVRTAEFDSAVEMLRECDGAASPHRIVIGPRGSGKTILLLRIAAEIRRDDDLSRRFHPVVFAEESYEVSTAGEFWLECLSRLAERAPAEEDACELRRTFEDLRTIRDDRMLADRCLGALLDFADHKRRRLVLVVENLNMMFGEMADGDAGWRLRQTLQTESRILLLASATSRFDEIDNPDRALYDLFRVVPLRPLGGEECAVLWEKVSGRRRDLDNMRALEILTGGSPRLIAIMARFGARLSFRELMEELLDLIDDHTEYFKSHLNALPAQERRVYLALAVLWKPATTREVADRARLDTSKCSAQLNRLIERGVVEVAGGGARRKQYYLTERLYNIYYLMRRSRGPEPVVGALVRFMEAFYSPRELTDFGIRLAGESTLDEPANPLHRLALAHLMESPMLVAYRDELQAGIPVGMHLMKATGVEAPEGQETARALLEEAAALHREGRSGDALARCEETIRRFGQADVPGGPDAIAGALVLKGDILAGLISTDQVWDLFAETIRRARGGGVTGMFSVLFADRETGLVRAPGALAVYDEVLRRFGGGDSPVPKEWIAKALISKGLVLLALDRTDEALAALDEATARFGHSDVPSLAEAAVGASWMKGLLLFSRGRTDEALAALDEAVPRLRQSDSSDDDALLATACSVQGFALVAAGRSEEALATWDEALGFFDKTDVAVLSEMAAAVLAQKAVTLAGLDRLEEALDAWDGVLLRHETIDSPALPEVAATALVNKGHMLGRLNRTGEALAVYDDFMRRYGKDDAPALLGLSADALFGKEDLLEMSNRDDEASTVCDEIVHRFAESETPPLAERAARALLKKGALLSQRGREEDALVAYDDVVRRFGDHRDPAIAGCVSAALIKKGFALYWLNRSAEALRTFEETVRQVGGNDSSDPQGVFAFAHVGRGLALCNLDRPQDALNSFAEAARLFAQSEHEWLRGKASHALIDKAALELKCERYAAAIETAGRALDPGLNPTGEDQVRAYLFRATAAAANGDRPACGQDIETALAILPELGSLPREALDGLMLLSVRLSPEEVHALVQASPAAGLLLPLTTALEWESGRIPRVAREVEEVARDIQKELASMRGGTPAAPSGAKSPDAGSGAG